MSTGEREELFTIGSRIASERKRLGLSQEALAKRLAVTGKTQVKYEAGNTYPNAQYLQGFDELGADVAFVVTGRRALAAALSLEAAMTAAGQAYRAALALGSDLSVEKFEKLFVTLCDTTAAREEAGTTSAPEPQVKGVHKVVQQIGAGSHNVQIGQGQLVASDAAARPSADRKKKQR
ncbi:hypothetical protein [Cupriavidus sp. AcVe19-1a]|uniref:helix-turn-helix domain-containing protein n=1 Tax=Cupriavidus sp. AcVe19-1a TaxID=2821359 RepID=UPI001AEB56BD|nr:hypothetical protein [Cupriavidus sp. AcVe19-1a]MBP0629764.1 hypothetical protein [Cupriavidus sp. AcVe19-1a]